MSQGTRSNALSTLSETQLSTLDSLPALMEHLNAFMDASRAQATEAEVEPELTDGRTAGAEGFVAPVTTSAVAGESHVPPSLLLAFPDVEVPILAAVITHSLTAVDLYKLDAQAPARVSTVMSFEGQAILSTKVEPMLKHYPTLASLIVPLATYFQVLARATPAKSLIISDAGFKYIAQLAQHSAHYPYAAVFAYHVQHFGRRRREMQYEGSYAKWGLIDDELRMRCLLAPVAVAAPVRGPPPPAGAAAAARLTEDCRSFASGNCADPCRWGRRHAPAA
jgi:hypothetical protein